MESKFEEKRKELKEAESKFQKACDQILTLNRYLERLQIQYNRAKATNHRSFRYNLRLRLAVVEGVRNTYYDYAHDKADQIAEMRRQLFGEIVHIISGDEADESDD